jgi:asparagine synthase (glutamine-hydrolysing)
MLSKFLKALKKGKKPSISDLAMRIRKERLTYLTQGKLHNMEACIENVISGNIPGDFVECGIALGGSGILLATRARADENCTRQFHGYDVFGMIPPPGERDDEKSHERYEVISSGSSKGIGGEGEYYGYMDDLYDRVVQAFASYDLAVDGEHVHLTRGLFEDALKSSPSEQIALAHIDCDWFDPVYHCLSVIYPNLSRGGFLIIDDYNDYGGCQKAVDRFIAENGDLEITVTGPNLVIRRR